MSNFEINPREGKQNEWGKREMVAVHFNHDDNFDSRSVLGRDRLCVICPRNWRRRRLVMFLHKGCREVRRESFCQEKCHMIFVVLSHALAILIGRLRETSEANRSARRRVQEEFLIHFEKSWNAMVCQTIKVGTNCIFMKRNGCSYKGGKCYPIIDSCKGCDRVVAFEAGVYCKSYSAPSIKWVNGPCSLATHVKKEIKQDRFKLNPLKASKRNISQKA